TDFSTTLDGVALLSLDSAGIIQFSVLGSQFSVWRGGDGLGRHSSNDPKPRACKPASWKYLRGRGWFVRYEGRLRFLPCAWHNCGAACGGWLCVLWRRKLTAPSARFVDGSACVLLDPRTKMANPSLS